MKEMKTPLLLGDLFALLAIAVMAATFIAAIGTKLIANAIDRNTAAMAYECGCEFSIDTVGPLDTDPRFDEVDDAPPVVP